MDNRIAIIGGGFAGLTAAYELGKKGYQIFLFERAPELGGLAGTFPIEGARLERGYHHWFTSDTHITGLMSELGIGERVMWIPSKVGFLYGGKIWNWVTPMDIMKFSPLPLLDRVRLGLTTFYLQTRTNKIAAYEKITAAAWLKKYAGAQAWEKAWQPLFSGKFGAEAERVPLLFLWYKARLRLGSRKGINHEVLGYPRGSFQVLINALANAIRKQGGKIFCNAAVKRVVVDNGIARGLEFADDENSRAAGTSARRASTDEYARFDRVICTAPSFVAQKLAEFPDAYLKKMNAVKYMGAVLLILKMKQSMSPIYWLNIADRTIPFVATIEQTNFLSPDVYNGKRVMYVSNYLDPASPYFQMSRDELFAAYLPALKKINPNFSPDWVEEFWHFKEAAAQPVMPLNYSKLIPAYRTPLRNLYLANTTQIYPEDRGTNYSVRLGQIIARLVDEDVSRGDEWAENLQMKERAQ
ncbi:MAG: NAD(P)/FAD-dependent oxidoreductase [Chloroflexi bacterium]|nr:NAD(P)/FAD-dependent oxidoreductase [Chloroflexota bacterium]MBI3742390.1 NAD(P)/FAD-dependent oxidoreductase [Chloroflexota bacterium]